MEGRVVSTRDEYRRNAYECRRLARSTGNALDKIVLVSMARTWDRLADHAAAISCHAELVAIEGGMKP